MNNELPLVSIICTSYNHEKYIAQAIKGFVMQKTTFPFEIIVHDDASTDNTANIVRDYEAKYPELFVNIYQTENQYSKGNGDVAKIVFSAARGKYIAVCEGDDYWTDPLKLQTQVDFLEAHLDFGLVHTDIEYVDTFSNPIIPPPESHMSIRKRVFNGYIFDYYLNNEGFILTTSCMFRKSLLDIAGAQQWFVYDLWLFMDIARKSKVYYIPEKTSAYRRNPNGCMMSNRAFFKTRTPNVLLDQIYRFYDKNHQTLPYYLENHKVEREVVICYTRLLYKLLIGSLKDRNKILAILKKNLIFIFKIPACAVYIIFSKIHKSK